MRRSSVRTLPLVVALAATVGGCYSYREVTPAQIEPGNAVRVRIAAEEAVRQQRVLGVIQEVVEGDVVEPATTGGVSLVVRRRPHGPTERGYSALVNLPDSTITRIEVKRFSAARTAGAAGAGAAVALLALAIRASATSDGGEPPPVQEMRVPLLRWSIQH